MHPAVTINPSLHASVRRHKHQDLYETTAHVLTITIAVIIAVAVTVYVCHSCFLLSPPVAVYLYGVCGY